ncbi:MAG: CHASE domain-containing protein, partial [Deltaproteobacteria bacterium]|nr:CHASE domain-containing protein [Deltaproteobacteria bacterium]
MANAARIQDLETATLAFESEIGVIEEAIRERLKSYEAMLYGTQALFVATRGGATREQFDNYLQTLQLEKRHPGVQSTGFAKRITASELAVHITALRAQGFADYRIHPEGPRSEYYPAIYVNPSNRLNSQVFGYDMFGDNLRRNSMTRARDTGLPSATSRVTLVQDTQTGASPGFIMYLPVYQSADTTPATLIERRAAISGFVFSQFRWDKLMSGIFSREAATVGFQLFEGDKTTRDSLLFQSYKDPESMPQNYQPRSYLSHRILFGGQTWALNFTALPAFDAATGSQQPMITALAGSAISFLLFAVLFQVQRTARQDHDFRQMIGEVKDYGIYMLDRDGRAVTWNKG